MRKLRVPRRAVVDGQSVEGVVCFRDAWGPCTDTRDVELGTLGPIAHVWARPVSVVFGGGFADAAAQLALAWSEQVWHAAAEDKKGH